MSIKADTAAEVAAKARSAGRTVYVYRFGMPMFDAAGSGPVAGAAEVIEKIEQAGWVLQQMAFDGHHGKHGAVLLLFRAR